MCNRHVNGPDLYWDFITIATKRSNDGNLEVINPMFAWLISGFFCKKFR